MPSKYQSTLKYMYAQLPMYQRQGISAFKKDLKNIIAFCDYLGNPQKNFKSIHIAGTNGKGTTSHIIAAGLQANGLKVGLYTSPHYVDFRERIKINGALLPAGFVTHFVADHKAVLQEIKPSFFEMTVAMAFQYFSKQEVDVAVIEVGLGGRLDSTNIITPLLSVITNISLDHQSMLGSTLSEIAIEKAGIIKKGVPVLIGEKQTEIEEVFLNKSKSVKTQIFFSDEIFRLNIKKEKLNTTEYELFDLKDKRHSIFSTDLVGPHQDKNIKTALASLYLLKDQLKLEWTKVTRAMAHVKRKTYYIGRWQQLGIRPRVIADSAHNMAGLKGVIARVMAQSTGKVHYVLGFVNDKEVSSILSLFPKESKFYFVKADIPRGLNADQLKDLALSQGLKGKAYTSVRRGLSSAKKSASMNDTIFIGGSIFVVAEVI